MLPNAAPRVHRRWNLLFTGLRPFGSFRAKGESHHSQALRRSSRNASVADGRRRVDRLAALRDGEGGGPASLPDRIDPAPVAVRAPRRLPVHGRIGRNRAYGQIQNATAVVVGVTEILAASGQRRDRILAGRLVAALVLARVPDGPAEDDRGDRRLVAEAVSSNVFRMPSAPALCVNVGPECHVTAANVTAAVRLATARRMPILRCRIGVFSLRWFVSRATRDRASPTPSSSGHHLIRHLIGHETQPEPVSGLDILVDLGGGESPSTPVGAT